MSESANEQFLDACERAFVTFAALHPDYKQTEAEAQQMAAELTASGLSPANPDHLSAVWVRIRPKSPPAQEAPAAESTDPIEREALRMIADGEVTVGGVRAMSSHELEMRIRNLAFCRALDLLPKPAPEPVRTRGDMVREAVLVERASKASVDSGVTWDPATEVEKSRREVASGYANYQPEAPKPQGGTPHFSGMSFRERSGRGMTLPKTESVSAILEQERKDAEWLAQQRNKSARATRVRANRRSR